MAKLQWVFVFLWVFISNCSFSLKAQKYNGIEYSGTVVNQADGKPVEGVLVLVGYSELYTRTDKNGYFTISNTTSASPEQLIFRHDSYHPKDTNITSSGANMHIELKPDERNFVFDQSKVHEYRFTITPEDSAYLATEGFREKYVQADMFYEGKAYGTVGIRYKGDFWLPTYFNPPGSVPKISYKVKFTEYDKDKRFYGMKRINLHSMLYDSTKMYDMLAYELYREMGINAPRTSYANVYVNDRLVGLFVAVEEIDGRFTKSRWPDYGNGNLYKEVWPKSADAKYYMDGLKTNDKPEDNPNVQRMISYYNAIQASDEQTFEQNVSPYMDFNYFLRYMAVDVAIKNWDGIRARIYGKIDGKPVKDHHNYYFYEEEKANGKIWLVPWDMDHTFDERDRFENYKIPEWNETPAHCNYKLYEDLFFIPPNCDKLTKLMAAVFWDRYVKLSEQFLKDQFQSQRLIDKINTHTQVILESVKRDPVINDTSWANEVSIFKSYIPNLATKFSNHIHSIKYEFNTYLKPKQLNDFEFKLADSNMYWIEKSFSDNSSGYVTHNTTNPLYSTADVRFDFTFRERKDSIAWFVYSNFQLKFEQPTDFSNLKEIRIALRSDKARTFRIDFDAFDVHEKYGVNGQYGWEIQVTAQTQTVTLKISEIAFPTADLNPDIKAEILKSVRWLLFTSLPQYDDNGFLKIAPDTGYLQVDNIEFVY